MRIPPATDRKGVAGWNYMILSALADVVQYCPVDVIQNQAMSLIQQTVEGCLKQFIAEDKKTGKHIIRHVNTLENQSLYLEDYVSFSDAQLRLYEITGNEIFKKNALETIDYILNQFMLNKKLHLTSFSHSTAGFDNLVAPTFDQSYRSSVMTFIYLLKRVSVLDAKFAPEEIFGDSFEEFAQFALTNPLGHGEGLRALTYPSEIIRKIEVPLAWLAEADFLEIRNHFFSRFVMTYQNQDSESYQICTRHTCEVQGKGLAQFKELFKIQEASRE